MRADNPSPHSVEKESKERKGSLRIPPGYMPQLEYPAVLHVAKKGTILYSDISSLQSLLDRGKDKPKKIPTSVIVPSIDVYYIHLEPGDAHDSKVTNLKNTTCDYVHMSSPPDAKKLYELPIKCGYVRCIDQIFYVDKNTKECTPLELDAKKLGQFDAEVKSIQRIITLSDKHLRNILSITNHKIHTKEELKTSKCDCVYTPLPMDEKTLGSVPIESGYVRSENRLFYIDKSKKEDKCVELPIDPEGIKQFDTEINSIQRVITLSGKPLDDISIMTSNRGKSKHHKCDCVFMSVPFDEKDLTAVPIESGYVRSKNQLYYVSKTNKQCVQLNIGTEMIEQFDRVIKSMPTVITFSDEQLRKIVTIPVYIPLAYRGMELRTNNPIILISSVKIEGDAVSANIQFVDTEKSSSQLYPVKVTDPIIKNALLSCAKKKDNGIKVSVKGDKHWTEVITTWVTKHKRKYLYSGGIGVGLSEHEIVQTPSPPDAKALDKLPIKCGYIRSKNQLFYVNIEKKKCDELKLDAKQMAKFDSEIKPNEKARKLSPKEVNAIAFFMPRHAFPDSAIITHIFEEDTLVLAAPYPIEDKGLGAKNKDRYSPIYRVALIDVPPKKIKDIKQSDYETAARLISGYMFAEGLTVYQQLEPFHDDVFATSPIVTNIMQGSIGNCFMLATASAILNHKDGQRCIKTMMQQLEQKTIVQLYEPKNLKPIYVCVPNVTCNYGVKPLSKHKAMWVHILEHAYAAFLFRYDDKYNNKEDLPSILSISKGGEVKNVLEAFTGRRSKEREIATATSAQQALVQDIGRLLEESRENLENTVVELIRSNSEIYRLLDRNEDYLFTLASYLNNSRDDRLWLALGDMKIESLDKMKEPRDTIDSKQVASQHLAALLGDDKDQLNAIFVSQFKPLPEEILETLKRNLIALAPQIEAGKLGTGKYTKEQLKLYNDLKTLHDSGHLLITSTLPNLRDDLIGIVNNHAYTIIDIRPHLKNKECLGVVLRNPWSRTGRNYDDTWKPIFSDKAEFWVELSDFTKFYTLCSVGRIPVPELKLEIKEQTKEQKEPKTYKGSLNGKEIVFNEVDESHDLFTTLEIASKNFIDALLKCAESKNARMALASEINDALTNGELDNIELLWDTIDPLEDYSVFLELKNNFDRVKNPIKQILKQIGADYKEVDPNKIELEQLINKLSETKPENYQKYIFQLQSLKEQEQLYKQRLCDIEVYQAYVRLYQKEHKDYRIRPGCKAIYLYGSQAKLPIYVWEKVKEAKELKEGQRVECTSPPDSSGDGFHILQFEGSTRCSILRASRSLSASLASDSKRQDKEKDQDKDKDKRDGEAKKDEDKDQRQGKEKESKEKDKSQDKEQEQKNDPKDALLEQQYERVQKLITISAAMDGEKQLKPLWEAYDIMKDILGEKREQKSLGKQDIMILKKLQNHFNQLYEHGAAACCLFQIAYAQEQIHLSRQTFNEMFNELKKLDYLSRLDDGNPYIKELKHNITRPGLELEQKLLDKLLLKRRQELEQKIAETAKERAARDKPPKSVSDVKQRLDDHKSLPREYVEVDVPDDNNCLFWSSALSLLLPLLQDDAGFNAMYERLFGTTAIVILNSPVDFKEQAIECKINDPLVKAAVKNQLIAYDCQQETPKMFEGGLLETCVCIEFRKRVVEKMGSIFSADDKKAYATDSGRPDWESYKINMSDTRTWGGQPEIKGISQLAGVNITVYSSNPPSTYNCAGATRQIYLVHTSTKGDGQHVNSHYRYGLDQNICQLHTAQAKKAFRMC